MVKNAGYEFLADASGKHHRRRWLNFTAADADNFRNGIDDKPGQSAGNIHDDDAGLTAVLILHQAEAPPHGDNRDHLAAQVDDPLDVLWHVRHLGNGRHADDLTYLEDFNPIFFIGQHEADQLDQLVILYANINFYEGLCGHGVSFVF